MILSISLLQSCKKDSIDSGINMQNINATLGVNGVTDSFFITPSFAIRVAERLPINYMAIDQEQNFNEVIRQIDTILPLQFDDQVLPGAYVVNYANDGGYVILSADARYEPILAYVNSGSFTAQGKLPSTLVSWINFQLESVEYLRILNLKSADHAQLSLAKWNNIYDNWGINNGIDDKSNDFVRPVGRPDEGTGPQYVPCTDYNIVKGPLLKTEWAQVDGFNDLLPNFNCLANVSMNGRPPVGCVATATAQILKYWSKPNANYNYSLMPNGYSGNTEVQTLMKDLGDLNHLQMNYSCAGSRTQSSRVPIVLKNKFGYVNFGEYEDYRAFPHGFNMVKADIDQREVVYLDGGNDKIEKAPRTYEAVDAHAWVCDGYTIKKNIECTPTHYLHMNWGWGDNNGFKVNGYYLESTWQPAVPPRYQVKNYQHVRKAIININPN